MQRSSSHGSLLGGTSPLPQSISRSGSSSSSTTSRRSLAPLAGLLAVAFVLSWLHAASQLPTHPPASTDTQHRPGPGPGPRDIWADPAAARLAKPALLPELIKPALEAALHPAEPEPPKLQFQLEDAAPAFVPSEHAANPRGMADSEEPDPWKRRQQSAWRLMILFQHNLPILVQALQGFQRASDIMLPNTIIIDNSQHKEAVTDSFVSKYVAQVVPTPSPLNFPQLHNFMATLALKQRLQFYFWAHADNYVMAMAPNRDMGKDVIDCLREQIARSPNWGMVLFAYDHLAAYRTQTLVQVPWDPHVFQYGSECDAYGRIRDAGYDAKACKVHYSYDMKRVVGIRPSDTYAEIKAALDKEAEDKSGRNAWRENAMSEKEQAWRKRMKEASRDYLKKKWGELKCKLRGVPCSQPWPYCPKCPTDFPDCYNKSPSWAQLDATHERVHSVFAADPNPPEPLEA